MKKKLYFLTLLYLVSGFITPSVANYSFKICVKYPFVSARYDSTENIVSYDSLARFRPIKPIIFRTETESLYQESVTNDSGYAFFTFDNWQDNTPIIFEDISKMDIDFPNTDRVIESDGKISFEHLRYSNVDFRGTPGEIEIILPMTVTKDEFTVGDPSWINSYNFAVMNDMHIGLFCSVMLTNQPLTHNKFRVKYV